MSTRFYVAWALVVVLAVALPVAIPYAVWPPHEGAHDDLMAECGRRAEVDAVSASHPVANLWPLSNRVESCRRTDAGALFYRAEVTARGPYGIPFARAMVTPSGVSWSGTGGDIFAIAALMAGVVLLSMPFAMVALRRSLRRRLALPST